MEETKIVEVERKGFKISFIIKGKEDEFEKASEIKSLLEQQEGVSDVIVEELGA